MYRAREEVSSIGVDVEAKRAIMRRVFGVKKEKAPAPTVEEATQRVSGVALVGCGIFPVEFEIFLRMRGGGFVRIGFVYGSSWGEEKGVEVVTGGLAWAD